MAESSGQLRFAVLHHTGVAEPHYDLLIELAPDALLATWRCETWPLSLPCQVERQPDHRRIYLDYEGPISDNRGMVRQVVSGSCHLLESTPTLIAAKLQSGPDRWCLKLSQINTRHWIITSLAR